MPPTGFLGREVLASGLGAQGVSGLHINAEICVIKVNNHRSHSSAN